MFVGIGWYKVQRDTYINGRFLESQSEVFVNQVIVNEDIELCSATIRLNDREQYRIPIKSFVGNYKYCG